MPVGLKAQTAEVLHTTLPETASFATPFTAQAVISHPAGAKLQLVKDSVPADFAITNLFFNEVSPEKTQADMDVLPLTLNKSTFTVSFALTTHPDQVVTLNHPLTVNPVQLFKDKKLKEIRPPKRPFDWALMLCILLAITALVCLLIWWIRKIRKDAKLLDASQDKRPAHIIALSQLDILIDSGLWEQKQYKLFYITLTDILRTYLQRAFGLDVSADTSAELLRRIKTQPQLAKFTQDLRAFLASGDLVKFAKAEPSENTRNQDITCLRQFITQTAPKPEPEVPATVEVKL
jgi:hypothetical protein